MWLIILYFSFGSLIVKSLFIFMNYSLIFMCLILYIVFAIVDLLTVIPYKFFIKEFYDFFTMK